MKKFGLIGEKLGHSLSPQIHKVIFENIHTLGEYDLVEIPRDDLKRKTRELFQIYNGLNVTIPYKKDIIPLLDSQDEVSKKIGAVNTIRIKDGSVTGYNTDYYGFGATIDHYKITCKNKKAVILGTGGVSKAIYHYLKDNNIGEIIFVNRRKETHWAKDCSIYTYDEIKNISGDIVINCTPLGMGALEDRSPVNKEFLTSFKAAIDLIYNPKETMFLKWAQEQGLQTINGMFMLVAQGVKAQEIWNEMEINECVIEKIYNIIDK